MVERKELDKLVWNLLRGFPIGFQICETIQEGVSYPRAIPKSFWLDEDKGYYGILGLNNLTKKDMRTIRDEVIERIIKEINEPSESQIYSDNYSRLFHALSILKVPKYDPSLPAIGKNYMYNISYDLWALDDGKSSTYEHIEKVAWFAAEAVKDKSLSSEDLLTGRRHTIL